MSLMATATWKSIFLGSVQILAQRSKPVCILHKDPPGFAVKWPWVKIQIVASVNFQSQIMFSIPTKTGSKLGGAPTPKWYHWF